jgi:hypothetical protein
VRDTEVEWTRLLELPVIITVAVPRCVPFIPVLLL